MTDSIARIGSKIVLKAKPATTTAPFLIRLEPEVVLRACEEIRLTFTARMEWYCVLL